MGVDLGSKKTGIAFSDPKRNFSLASRVLDHKNNNLSVKVMDLIKEYSVGGIVVGIPLNDDGSSNKMCQSIKDKTKNMDFKFVSNNINLPIIFWDESYTSIEAFENIKNILTTKKRQNKVVDKFAAQIILQDFLDYIKKLNEK